MIKIFPVKAFADNYIWIITNDATKQAIVVDPGDAEPVINFLNSNHLQLSAILITHKHFDHIGGIDKLLLNYPASAVYANQEENISAATHFIDHQKIIHIEKFPMHFEIIKIPGHTAGHAAYYSKPYLFCGDTLFAAGCGRIFEGTAEQMLTSLKKLAALPNDTLVYCAHEYTKNNLLFALHVEPNNPDIKKRLQDVSIRLQQNEPTVPSTILLEKKTNPFLRCSTKTIVRHIQAHDQAVSATEVSIFEAMRKWKNDFQIH